MPTVHLYLPLASSRVRFQRVRQADGADERRRKDQLIALLRVLTPRAAFGERRASLS